MIYSYYPGCSLHSTAKEYDISLKAICPILGVELKEVKNWICCGASSAHVTSKLLSISLPTKSLAEVEKEGKDCVLVPCAACYSRLKTARYELENSPELLKDVSEIIGYPFKNEVKVLHPLEVFKNSDLVELTKKNIKKDLSKLKVVCYYGCLLTRPPKVMQFDESEYPLSMDEILENIGVTVLDWSYKTDCCGASLALTKSEIVLRLINNIFENAKAVGAEAIAVGCTLCHTNLDTRQEEVNKVYNKNYNLPILFFTQILGLALGIEAKELSLNTHFVSPDELLSKIT